MNLATAACAALSSVLLVAAGCSAGDDLFSGGDPIETTSGGGGDPQTSSSSAGNNEGSVVSSSVTSAAGGASPTTTTTTTSASGGSTGEGGAEAVSLDCGGNTCPVGPNSACCWDQYLQHGEPQAVCVMGDFTEDQCLTAVQGDDFGYETRIECQLPSHCASGICCANRRQSQTVGSLYISVECVEDCSLFDGGLLICENSGSTDGCPMLPTQNGGMVQSVCKPSTLLPPNYNVCGYP